MRRSKPDNVFSASCLMFALLFIRTSEGIGGIIPADRVNDWTPGVKVGVPRGIPKRTTIGKNAVTDRGAGMGATVLQCYNSNSNGVIVNSGDTLTTPTVTITSGATKGSTSVTVNTTSGIRVHKLILISGLNPSF